MTTFVCELSIYEENLFRSVGAMHYARTAQLYFAKIDFKYSTNKADIRLILVNLKNN
jgi:hypothetical protein